MSKLKVLCFSVSVDGYGAGSNHRMDNPMGDGGMALHEWVFPTKTFQALHKEMPGGKEDTNNLGSTGIDDHFASKGFENIGAWIMGRYMFGPMRGPWEDFSYKGWWGENPPYHTPVYILTNYPRQSIEMAGGTTFHFVTDGIESALNQAKKTSGGKDIRLGGGVNTVRQYLLARLVDEMHIALAPCLLGSGQNLFHGLDLLKLGYECTEFTPSEKATHLVFKKK